MELYKIINLIISVPIIFILLFRKQLKSAFKFKLFKVPKGSKQTLNASLKERCAYHELGHITAFKFVTNSIGEDWLSDMKSVAFEEKKSFTTFLSGYFQFEVKQDTQVPVFELAVFMCAGYTAEAYFNQRNLKSVLMIIGCHDDVKVFIELAGSVQAAQKIWGEAVNAVVKTLQTNETVFLKQVDKFIKSGSMNFTEIKNYLAEIVIDEELITPESLKGKYVVIDKDDLEEDVIEELV